MFSVNLSGRIGQHFTHLPSSARNNFSLRQHITTENNQLVTEGRRRSGETVSRKQKSSCFLNYSDSNKNSHTFIALSPAVVWHCNTWALYRTRGFANHPFPFNFLHYQRQSTAQYFKSLPVQCCQHASREPDSIQENPAVQMLLVLRHTRKTNSFTMVHFVLGILYQPLLQTLTQKSMESPQILFTWYSELWSAI